MNSITPNRLSHWKKRIWVLCLTFMSFVSIQVHAQIVLNHFLLTVDSTTYQEILNSKILNSSFAYAQEKKLSGYSGIYIFGRDNYIEIFNPNSIENEQIELGTSWICYSSMKANQLKEINATNTHNFEFSNDDYFDELSLYFQDSTNLLTTWEMKKMHYENWAKKTYNDTVSFLSVDYNSPADADSTKNYSFNNVLGLKVLVNSADSVAVLAYMEFIGYSKTTSTGVIRFSNSTDFIEFEFRPDIKSPTVTTIYLELKNSYETEQIAIGKSELYVEGKQAIWVFN